jgi:IclR family transcriptional regulator, KDG regulon repressor
MHTSSTSDAGPKSATGTAAFSKFMAVLQLIADADEPMSIPALGAASGYPRPTVYRIIGALVAEGLVNESPRGGKFDLGPRLVNLASRSWERSYLRVAAIDALVTLRDVTRETVHLAVPSQLGMVYIEKLESPHAVRMASRVGTRVTLYSSSVGKAFLATLTPAKREQLLDQLELLPLTPNTITDPVALRQELDTTAERGYAEDREENEAQIFCYGAAIVGTGGEPLGCISISLPMFRRDPAPHRAYVEPLLAACGDIARRLGQRPELSKKQGQKLGRDRR